MTWTLAAFFRPFIAILILWLICRPIKRFVWRHLRDSKLKRFLFYSWKV